MNTPTIRPYDPQHDEQQVYNLWQHALGQLWPLSQAMFHRVTVANDAYQPGDHLVAQVGRDIVGFVGTQSRRVPGEPVMCGELMLIMVDSAYQRQGIGHVLLDCALDVLRQRGVTEVQLGGGGLSYFWSGVPTNLSKAWMFFQACGWTETERSFDLVQDMSDYVTPSGVYERVRLPNVTIATATPEDIPLILAFEERNFPKWFRFYQQVIGQGRHADVVLARHPDYGIVGTSCAEWRHNFVWERLLGSNAGGIGPLGVAEDVRENGIGLALAARVSELLCEHGVKTSYVHWTWLVDWYGRLGYKVWQEYAMSWKKL